MDRHSESEGETKTERLPPAVPTETLLAANVQYEKWSKTSETCEKLESNNRLQQTRLTSLLCNRSI